jgi:hypothetical protein
MTTPPRRPPDPSSQGASRGDKVRNAKSDQYGAVGRGIGEAPNSRLKMLGIWLVIAMIVPFIIIDVVDRNNAKKKKSFHYAPTSDLVIEWRI